MNTLLHVLQAISYLLFSLTATAVKKLAEKNIHALELLSKTETVVDITEQLIHGEDEHVVAKINVSLSDNSGQTETLNGEMSMRDLYPKIVCKYFCKPKSEDLSEACKRFLDPLSFSSFLELIRYARS